MKTLIAIEFAQPVTGQRVMMFELHPHELDELVTAKSNQRFMELGSMHIALDNVLGFWDPNEEDEIG